MKSLTEQYQCQSYSDDDRNVQDCTCGKCGNTSDTEWETKAIDAIIATYPEDLWPEPEYKPRNAEVAWVMRCMSKAIASILEPVVEELLTSRDTYWKERVRERILSNAYPIGMKNPIEVVDVKDIISETQ